MGRHGIMEMDGGMSAMEISQVAVVIPEGAPSYLDGFEISPPRRETHDFHQRQCQVHDRPEREQRGSEDVDSPSSSGVYRIKVPGVAKLGTNVTMRSGHCVVTTVPDGSLGLQNGVRPGDVLLLVGGVSMMRKTFTFLKSELRSHEHEPEVTLCFWRGKRSPPVNAKGEYDVLAKIDSKQLWAKKPANARVVQKEKKTVESNPFLRRLHDNRTQEKSPPSPNSVAQTVRFGSFTTQGCSRIGPFAADVPWDPFGVATDPFHPAVPAVGFVSATTWNSGNMDAFIPNKCGTTQSSLSIVVSSSHTQRKKLRLKVKTALYHT